MSIKNLSKFTRVSLTISFVFLVYGYFCRILGIYFFWESKTAGWTIFMIGLISFLSDWINFRDEHDKKSIGQKIGIGFIVFGLLMQIIMAIAIPNSDAFEAAKIYIKSDSNLKQEIGEINGFGLIPIGGIGKTTRGTGEVSGNADINLTIKGTIKFKDVEVFVLKTADSPVWKVVKVEKKTAHNTMFLLWCGDVLPKVYIFVPRLVSGTGRGFGSAPQQKHTRCVSGARVSETMTSTAKTVRSRGGLW